MGKRNNTIIISGILVAFLIGVLSANPVVDAVSPVVSLLTDATFGLEAIRNAIDDIESGGIPASTQTQIDSIETETGKIQMLKNDVADIKSKTGSIFSDGTGALTGTNPFHRQVVGVDGEQFVINISAVCSFFNADPANTAIVRINDGLQLFHSALEFREQDNSPNVVVVTGFVSGFDRPGDGIDDRTFSIQCIPGPGTTFRALSHTAIGWTP